MPCAEDQRRGTGRSGDLMYKCHGCGELFDVPEVRCGETVEYWGTTYRVPYNACPCCGWDDFREVDDEDLGDR